MTRLDRLSLRVGPYRASVVEGFDRPDFMQWLAGLCSGLEHASAVALTAGRNRLVRIEAPVGGEPVTLVVKSFGVSAPSSLLAFLKGSKALRTWRIATAMAARGVPTPAPVACLERWQGVRLAESYYLSVYEPQVTTFKRELIRLFRHEPTCARLMALLQAVAVAIRRLHDAGIAHYDLGNQNIMLRRTEDGGWRDVMFVDLNRARVRRSLSLRQRGRDLSRIYLPSDLLRVFLEMYWHPEVPPAALLEWEHFHRRAYSVHCATRAWRHPVRSRMRRPDPAEETYLSERDLWIWDDRSGQAISTMLSRDRRRFQAVGGYVKQIRAVLACGLSVRRHYRRLLASAYGAPLPMAGRVRVAVEGVPETLARELAALDRLGPGLPVHVRFYHHESSDRLDQRLAVARDLRAAGHPVSAALVQDRRAVLDPAAWATFAGRACAGLDGVADWVEMGHAINRVKWGLWRPREYRVLMAPLATLARRHPALAFTGPAGIDFEYPFVLAALRHVPAGVRFAALSHHLYVDRRGAPENRQGRFSTLEKLALGRAIAASSPACAERFIVSEVNWPLAGTGVYSPVGSPYESPGERTNDPSVSESTYAEYMVRYLAMALCSGLADEVVWWRLAAHGYGLIDDRAPGGDWRERDAFAALRVFLDAVAGATFRRRVPPGEWGGVQAAPTVHVLAFQRASGGSLLLAWSHPSSAFFRPPARVTEAYDIVGDPVAAHGDGYELGGRPTYFILAA